MSVSCAAEPRVTLEGFSAWKVLVPGGSVALMVTVLLAERGTPPCLCAGSGPLAVVFLLLQTRFGVADRASIQVLTFCDGEEESLVHRLSGLFWG